MELMITSFGSSGAAMCASGSLDVLEQGSPTAGPTPVHDLLGTRPQSRRWAAGEQAKLHLPLPIAPHHSHYLLNQPPPPPSVEKLSSTKPVPGAKKVGDHCVREIFLKAWIYINYLISSFEFFKISE